MKARERKAENVGGKALERQRAMNQRYQTVLGELLQVLESLPEDEDATSETLLELQLLFKRIAPKKKDRPLFGTLPYKQLNYSVQTPQTSPVITPAYRSATPASMSGDTQGAPEAPISVVIAEKAQELGWSPVKIYEWVKNNIETEWYWGAMKGAEQTLEQGSGNDADQAALLVALLRASGYPARYVRGLIEFYPEDLARISNLIGIQDTAKIGEFFQKAGIPFQQKMSGATVVNYQIEHIWVETEVPYANYRGIVADTQGEVWVALDTSIKVAQYTESEGQPDLYQELNNPLLSLRDDYLSTQQTLSPLAYLQAQTQAYLDQYHPGTQYSDLLTSRTLSNESLQILPASLQFKEIAVTGEYAQFPNELLHQVHFLIPGTGEPVLEMTLPGYALSSRTIVMSFEPETVEDQEIINAWGGLDNTPSYLVRLRPVLLIDGERIVVGREGYAVGDDLPLTLEFVSPLGQESVTNTLQAGYPTVLGIVAQQVVLPAAEEVENEAVDLLHREVLNYIDDWNRAEEEVASLTKVALVRPVPTAVTFGGVLEVVTLLGEPYGAKWKGLYVDADLRAAEVVNRLSLADGRERVFMEAAALHGSVLENQVFETAFAVESISTAKLFGVANDALTPILTIDAANVDTLLPSLLHAENIKTDIAAAVALGYQVRIPETELTVQAWTGTGYIKEKPATGEAGYMLSGAIAGGMTVLGIENWPQVALQPLAAPYTGEPNSAVEEAYKIDAITPWDAALATAGQETSGPLMVLVRDIDNVPVKGAPVTFSVRVGGGALIDDSVEPEVQTQTLTVTTDYDGIARVRFVAGQSVYANPINFVREGDSYANIVGENLVDASLDGGSQAALPSPLAVLGFAGEPDLASSPIYGNNQGGDILSYSGGVVLLLRDRYDNPIANYTVNFAAQQAVPDSASQCNDLASFDQSRLAAQLIDADQGCIANIPTYGECSAAAQNVSVSSKSDGSAGIGVVLGAVPFAKYPITGSFAIAGGTATTNLQHYSRSLGSCFIPAEPENKIVLDYNGHYDELANNVDARPANSSAVVQVKAYLLGEGDQILSDGESLSCTDGDTLTCNMVTGDGNFTVSQPPSMTVTIDGKQPAPVLDSDGTTPLPGLYQSQVLLPLGLNDVTVESSATKDVLVINNSCSAGCGTAQTVNKTIGPASKTLQIWGVDLQVPDIFTVALDANGYASQDTVFNYDILPSGYKANMAQVLMYKDGELVFAAPTAETGSPSLTIPAGFWFDSDSSYSLRVLLNNLGDADEILSEEIPVLFGVSGDFGGYLLLPRTHLVSEFDDTVPATIGSAYKDVYQAVDFYLAQSATVQVAILDANRQPQGTLVPATALAAGSYHFVVDHGQLRDAGFDPQDSPNFFLELQRTDQSSGEVEVTLYAGLLSERASRAKMLGQTMVHDVLIQDGSLNLSRQDFALKGRGPQIAFGRSYNNQYMPRGFKPLGPGWSHSLDLRLRVVSTDSSGSDPVPSWVTTWKGQFYTDSQVTPDAGNATVVQVNGTVFKKYNGVWYAERSKHGTLEEVSGGYRFTAKDGTRYIYDQPYGGDTFVSAIEDRNGNQLSFVYNAFGQLESVTDAVGRSCTFSYESKPGIWDDNNNRLTSVTCLGAPDTVTLNFAYDAHGYLASVQRGERLERYEYEREIGNAKGEFNLSKAFDGNGYSYSYAYHAPGEVPSNLATFTKFLKAQDIVKSVTYPDGHAASFQYDVASENKRIVTDLRGNPTTYALNFFGNPTRIEEPLGKVTQMTWSIDQGLADNVMTSMTVSGGTLAAPLDLTTSYLYDAKGNVTKETDPYGNFIQTTWNQAYSLPESRTDRNGVVQTWNYDAANGNLLWQEDGDQKRTDYTYTATGEVETVTDPLGNVTRHSYDAYGNPDLVTVADGTLDSATIDFDYDPRGRKIAETDPLGNRTDYAYDDLDYPETVTYPLLTSYALASGSSNVKTSDYDVEGNLLSETDRVGLTLSYSYTPRNQVETITRSTGGSKSFAYDENGNLLSESDWKGVATSHTYDALNRRDGTTNRLGDAMSMAYDLAGNLIQATDYAGRVTDYQYDKLQRRTKVIQPLLPGQSLRGEIVTSYYDEADPETNVMTVTDAEGHVTTFEYNGRYLRTKRINALLDEYVWQYDDAGNLAKEIDEEGDETRYTYDHQNRRTFSYRALKDETDTIVREIPSELRYDAAGNVRFRVDPRGNISETTFDQWNRPWQVNTPADPVAYTTTTELDGEGRKVKVIDGNGHVRTWLRDERGLVLTATDAETQPTNYSYDLNGNQETVTDARGYLTRTSWDAEDRQLLTTAAEGSAEQRIGGVVLYDKLGNPLQVRDGNGKVTVSEYNGLNLPWKVYDPAPFNAQFVETLYDRNGKPLSVKNRRGHVTSTAYDELGRVVLVTDPAPFASQTIVTSYDKVGRVKTVTDKRGILTENDYDSLGRLLETRRMNASAVLVRLISNEYDDAGNKTATVDAESNRIEYLYSPRNLLATTTYIDGVNDYTEQRTYDGVGNLLTLTNEDSEVTSYSYDKENRLKTTTFAAETTETFYDQVGNPIRVQKPKGNEIAKTYDGLNRLSSVTEGGLLTTSFSYDANDNLRTQQDPRGNLVEYSYDALNRKIQHIQHKGSGNLVVSFDSYDPEGNLTQLTDAKGQVFSYEYDELNRRTRSVYPVVATPFLTIQEVVTGYDANNNVTQVIETKQDDQSATVTDSTVNTWDNFDRLKTSTQRGIAITYDYDNNGNRTGVTTANGSTSYTYDHRNRLQTAVVGSDVTSYSYTPEGLTETIGYPNGASAAYTYWPTNRVETITHQDASVAVISSFSYQYDSNGNRSQQVAVQAGTTETTDYSYDTLDRLEGTTLTSGSDVTVSGYTFEGYNRKTETVTVNSATTVAKTYAYDETDWLTQVVDSAPATPVTITYSYDDNGNTVEKTVSGTGSDPEPVPVTTTFDYDVADRLVQTTQGVTNLGRYDYNAQGMRIRHYGSERGDVEYFYDDGAVLEEYLVGAGGGLLAHYRYGDRLLSLDAPADGGVQYYHHDALGSTVNLSDSAGSVKVSYTLDPWGHIRNQVGSSVNRQVFTGQEHDENTGLIYFGARYYDPDSARFISQDSYLGEPGTPPSLHRYLYAYSNPTVYIDLYGFMSWDGFQDGVGQLWNGLTETFSKTAQTIPYIYSKSCSEFDRALDNAYDKALENDVPGIKHPFTQGVLTGGITFTKTIFGMGSYPLRKGSQTIEFAQDPSIENFPIYFTEVRDAYRASEEYAKNPTFENGWNVVGAGSGGVLEAAAIGYGVKAIAEGYTTPRTGITAEYTAKTNVSLNNPFPKNGRFSRVMPRKYAEAFARGESPIGPLNKFKEVFIGAADDLVGVDTISGAQERLSLFKDYSGKVPNLAGDTVVTFKLKDVGKGGIRSPIETKPGRGYGFKKGGKTAGKAREWLIDVGTADEIGAYDIQMRTLK